MPPQGQRISIRRLAWPPWRLISAGAARQISRWNSQVACQATSSLVSRSYVIIFSSMILVCKDMSLFSNSSLPLNWPQRKNWVPQEEGVQQTLIFLRLVTADHVYPARQITLTQTAPPLERFPAHFSDHIELIWQEAPMELFLSLPEFCCLDKSFC